MPEMPADEPGARGGATACSTRSIPRSYMDTNADGIGDLRGITARLDHLQWLGVDGIWLDPIMLSPNKDWGYDVADYCAVDPALGTLADAEELVGEAAERGIRVMLDLVPNHSSDQHPWFQDSHLVTHVEAPRLVRVGRSEARRLPAQQLGDGLRPARARRGPSTTRAASTTSTSSSRRSPTSTGGTTTCATPSTTSCASGSTAASPASASTCATRSSRTASSATTRSPPRTITGGCR